jgi:hypothetical protein
MAAVFPGQAPSPRLSWEEQPASVPTAYAAVRITSAVNLLEDRAYRLLGRGEQLALLLAEDRALVSAIRDERPPTAFDLRILADPSQPVPIQAAIVVRAWQPPAGGPGEPGPAPGAAVTAAAGRLLAALPRRVTGAIVGDQQELLGILRPFAPQDLLRSALITRPEIIGTPARPDAKASYYFSVQPFSWLDSDWTPLFSMLATTRARVAISVAVLPFQVPENLTGLLQQTATFYGRLARADTGPGALWFGQRTLPADPFAAAAEPVFSDYARRYQGRVFALRIQVSATPALPRGLVEMLGSLISPAVPGAGGQPARQRGAAYQIRQPRSAVEEELGRWNLDAVDFILQPGNRRIWERPDPPPALLRPLCVLADTRDASCAFRLPAALDGTLPGFQVGRGYAR